MKSCCCRTIVAVACALAIGFGAQKKSDAALLLRLTALSGPTTGTITDNVSLADIDPDPGVITRIGSIGGFTTQITTAISKPNNPNPYELHLNNVSIVNVGSFTDTLLIEMVDDSFAAPGGIGPGFVLMTVGPAFGPGSVGSVSYIGYVDPLDQGLFSTGTSYFAGTYTSSDSFTGFAPHGTLPEFSLGLTAIVTLAPGSSLSFDAFITLADEPEGSPLVPEPTSLAIWGLGLSALGFIGYKKRRRRVSS